jgi:N-acetylglutamate synthase-like GNAT family acetyltransferase
MNVHIRRIEKEDVNVVSEIICRNFMEVNIKDYPREEMEYLCQTYTPQKIFEISDYAHMYVACLENDVVGCGAIHSFKGKKDESMLKAVFVLPELHGQGIGKEILGKLEEDKMFLSAKRVEVLASITACKFYLKRGYTYKGGVKELDGDGLYHLEKLRK